MSLIEDEKNISKCIDLAKQALDQGEAPFASIITKNGQIISEAINGAQSKVSDHAEILALHKAHKSLKAPNLSACTLYSICEPCPMCSFMIREYKISKVVFALVSPFLGGYTKWSILQDEEMTQFEKYFSPPPTIVAGILENEAKKVFDQTPLWMFGSKIKK